MAVTQSDLNLRGVTGSALGILGMVTLLVQMKKGIPIKQMDVGSNFQHPPDGLLGITEFNLTTLVFFQITIQSSFMGNK